MEFIHMIVILWFAFSQHLTLIRGVSSSRYLFERQICFNGRQSNSDRTLPCVLEHIYSLPCEKQNHITKYPNKRKKKRTPNCLVHAHDHMHNPLYHDLQIGLESWALNA